MRERLKNHRMVGFSSYFAVPTFLILYFANSPVIDAKVNNRVVDKPSVQCSQDGLAFEMATERPFTGQLYVKNEYENVNCRADFGDVHMPFGSMTLRFSECGMRRQRMMNPRGVAYTVTLMVKFHPIFVTGSDRAYQVQCFYRESEQFVKSEYGVSELTTQQIEADFPFPECKYEIRHADERGETVTFARVGDPIVHVFQCENSEMYGMLVRNCHVDDGKSNKQLVIGDDGCPIDTSIMPSPSYTRATGGASQVAVSEGKVFKWPDQPHVYFSCQVSLCMKTEGECEGMTPPRCGERKARRRFYKKRSRRHRRSAERNSSEYYNYYNGSGDADYYEYEYYDYEEQESTSSDKKTNRFDLQVNKLMVLDIDDGASESSDEDSREESSASPERSSEQFDRSSISFRLATSTPTATSHQPAPTQQEWPEWPRRSTRRKGEMKKKPKPYNTPREPTVTTQGMATEAAVAKLKEHIASTDLRESLAQLLAISPSIPTLPTMPDSRVCYGPELLAAFTFLLTLVLIALSLITARLLYPCYRHFLPTLFALSETSSVTGHTASTPVDGRHHTSSAGDLSNFDAWRKAYGGYDN